MRKKLIILLASLMLVGCSNEKTVNQSEPSTYFVKVSKETYGSIVYDSRTGIEYWRSEGYYNNGTLTVLLDTDGNPLVYKETK